MRTTHFINPPKNMVDSVFRFFPLDIAQRYEKRWKETSRWANKVANYFPRTFKEIPLYRWHKTDWEGVFNKALPKNWHYREENKAFFLAIAERDLDALKKIIVEHLGQASFCLHKLLDKYFLWETEDLLSPSRPNDSEEIRAEIWKLITRTSKEPELLPLWALATFQPQNLIKDLIDEADNINAIHSWDGITMLYAACKHGYVEIVELLLNGGADINTSFDVQDHEGDTPLHLASRHGHTEIAKLLLDRGAEVNIIDNHFFTPLHEASEYGHFEIVGLLLDRGADIHAENEDDYTPLTLTDSAECAELLVNRDSSLDPRQLNSAINNDNIEMVRFLLDRGVNVNAGLYHTPLTAASRIGNVEFVNLLLDQDADVNAVTELNTTPLSEASDNNQVEVVKLLLDRGANSFSVFPWKLENNDLSIDRLLLEKSLVGMAFEKPPESDQYLSELGKVFSSYVEEQIYYDKPDLLLLFAILTNQPPEEIKRIIAAGANPFGSNPYGINPCNLAMKFCPDAVDYLKAYEEIKRVQDPGQGFSDLFGLFSLSAASYVQDPYALDFDEESAGYDNSNEKKRSLNAHSRDNSNSF